MIELSAYVDLVKVYNEDKNGKGKIYHKSKKPDLDYYDKVNISNKNKGKLLFRYCCDGFNQ